MGGGGWNENDWWRGGIEKGERRRRVGGSGGDGEDEGREGRRGWRDGR